MSPYCPNRTTEGTEGPRLVCHNKSVLSASNAKILLCIVATKSTFRDTPSIVSPETYNGWAYTCPSTGSAASLPKPAEFTVEGESWYSCKFEFDRSLLPLAVSILTCP